MDEGGEDEDKWLLDPQNQSEVKEETQSSQSISEKSTVRKPEKEEKLKGVVQEMARMNEDLQTRQFQHEERMQRQWAEYIDKRDKEHEKREERRQKDIENASQLERQNQLHAQAMQQNQS